MAVARPNDPEYRPIRLEAVSALASMEGTPEVVEAPGIRRTRGRSRGPVRRRAMRSPASPPGGPRSWPHASCPIASSFHRLPSTARVTVAAPPPRGRTPGPRPRGRPPRTDRSGDVEGLAAVAEDRTLPEATRLGAIEGLAATALEPAEAVLRRIGLAAEEDEELCKAAWAGCVGPNGRGRKRAGQCRGEDMSAETRKGRRGRVRFRRAERSGRFEVHLAYAGAQHAGRPPRDRARLTLAGNLRRDPVRLEATIKHPLRFREAISALYAVVASDYRYVPKDRTAYLAYTRMRRES